MGFCKTFAKDVMNGGKIVLKGLKGPVGGFLITIAGVTVLAMNGVDISAATSAPSIPSPRYQTPPSYNSDFEATWNQLFGGYWDINGPDKLAEEGIQKIAESSKGYDFDANLLCAAREIRDIAKRTGSGYRAKSTAMTALSEIAGRCDFDGSKKQIASFLKEIATSM